MSDAAAATTPAALPVRQVFVRVETRRGDRLPSAQVLEQCFSAVGPLEPRVDGRGPVHIRKAHRHESEPSSAYVHFASAVDAETAVRRLHDTEVEGARLLVALNNHTNRIIWLRQLDEATLLTSPLPSTEARLDVALANRLGDEFSAFGSVERVRPLRRNADGRFDVMIEFRTLEQAQRALVAKQGQPYRIDFEWRRTDALASALGVGNSYATGTEHEGDDADVDERHRRRRSSSPAPPPKHRREASDGGGGRRNDGDDQEDADAHRDERSAGGRSPSRSRSRSPAPSPPRRSRSRSHSRSPPPSRRARETTPPPRSSSGSSSAASRHSHRLPPHHQHRTPSPSPRSGRLSTPPPRNSTKRARILDSTGSSGTSDSLLVPAAADTVVTSLQRQIGAIQQVVASEAFRAFASTTERHEFRLAHLLERLNARFAEMQLAPWSPSSTEFQIWFEEVVRPVTAPVAWLFTGVAVAPASRRPAASS